MPSKKVKEFYWNKFARNDYLYFANCRIYAHFWNFIYDWPKANCLYLSSKTNGDFNGVLHNVKIKKADTPHEVNTSFWQISDILVRRLCKDLHFGLIGKFCYVIVKKNKYYFLYRIEMKSLEKKSKNKILYHLRKYRSNRGNSKVNERFMDFVELSSYIDPTIVINYPKKKIKMFKNKKIYSGKHGKNKK